MKEKKRSDISVNLLDLQNKLKRDPSLYYDEFSSHYEYYKEVLKLFMMKPTTYNEELADLIAFLAQVSSCYKKDLASYPQDLITILKENFYIMDSDMRMVSSCYKKDLASYPQDLITILKENFYIMDSDMRMCFCKALILLRNRGMIEAIDLIPLFFLLLRAKDKLLRKLLQIHIISDIKRMNVKHKNIKLNTTLQNLMYKMLNDDYAIASKMSLDIMIELYKKHIWNDKKTVNAIATACFSKVNKILVAAHQFFLGSDEVEEEKDSSDSEKEDDTPNVKDVMAANKVNKKSRRRMKILKRTKQALKRSKKKKNKEVYDFSAIHLLHDPQGMAEKLLKMLSEMNERYEIKMMVMNLISRLVGVHELILLNYYVLLIRYLKPHQRDVTKILTFAAQAAHEKVPPDAIEPVIKTIAYNFVSERNSFEAMTVGINAIREICARCPLAISTDLLQDIAEYKNYKNKNVAMAARSIIQLYRKISPQMLKRKFKSRPTEASKELDTLEYGALKAKSYIPGTEVLPVEPSKEDNNEKIATKTDEDSSEDGWIDVSHSEDEINIKSEEEEEEDDDVEDEEDSSEDEQEIDAEEKDEEKEAQFAKGEKRKVEIEGNEKEVLKDIKKLHKKPKTGKENDGVHEEKDEKENSISEVDKSDKQLKKEADDTDDKQKAMLISQSRVLSQEEFKMLKAAQIAKEVQFAKGKKRKVDAEVNYEKEIVSLKDIEKLHKKPKTDKATRLATVLEGREGREKFGKKNKKNPKSGKTQKEHNKRKAFMMIKHKVRSKQKRSFKDKQIALRNALLKRRRNK